jgi:ABC-type siderophore export system fused ATPase/permease subunit
MARLGTVLRASAWLVLVLALAQRFVLRIGSSERSVYLSTVVLLLVAVALRIAAWRISKTTRRR